MIEEDLLKTVKPKTLLLLDKGFYHFAFWSKLISQEIGFITRIKKGASYQIERVLTNTYDVRYQIIKIGAGTKQTPALTIRLVQIRSKTSWRSYLTSVREPERLPPYVVSCYAAKPDKIALPLFLIFRSHLITISPSFNNLCSNSDNSSTDLNSRCAIYSFAECHTNSIKL